MISGIKQVQKAPIPTESEEQQCLFRWASYEKGKYPELELLYHIPNGGKRYAATAKRLKAEGVKSGVPDLCLPVPRGLFNGLYIELKRTARGKISDNQNLWIEALRKQGYCVLVCNGWEQAAGEIINYLNI